MGYDGKILGRAAELYEQRTARHEQELDERARALETRFPRLREIDIQLRRSVIQAINAALSAGSGAGDSVRAQQEKNRTLRRERADLLEKNGYPGSFLDREPLCLLCGDTGYTEKGMCGCLRAIYLEEQKHELESTTGLPAVRWSDVDLNLFSDEKTGSSRISPRENMQYVIHVCRSFAEERKCRGNLFFSGPPGTGKTYLAACLAYAAADLGIFAVYDSAVRLLPRYEDARFRRDDETARQDIARCENCDLLILDDLGTEMSTSVTNAGLYQLLNTRLTAKRAGVFLTNQSHEELRRRYPPQILSRLESGFQTLRFFGGDIRKSHSHGFL